MSKQIEEVMALVDEFGDLCESFGDFESPKTGEQAMQKRESIEAKLRELLPVWQPIESAPKDVLVMVYIPPQKDDDPESVRIDFDFIDTGIAEDYWYNHGENYEHFCCVAKPEGSIGPKEKAPYTHWMPLPKAPE